MQMPWPEALQFSRAVRRLRRDRLIEMACAARFAQADGKDWERGLKEIGQDR